MGTGSKRIKVLSIFGTRPEAVKMAPLCRALSEDSTFESIIGVTGQHREMLDQVLSIFKISPDFDLNVMKPNQTLSSLTSSILNLLESPLQKFCPDWILVHGDTTTALAASLAGFYARIRVGHVEAGLRSRKLIEPWPEEMNRRVVDQISAIHFAPTASARNNLLEENFTPTQILVTGNTVVDALRLGCQSITENPQVERALQSEFSFLNPQKKLILVTGHRRENFGEGLGHICDALLQLASRGDTQIVYPVHLNPNVQEVVQNKLMQNKNILLIPPQEYLAFVYLMQKSYLILTDSGGIQEEAPALGKPVLVMRDRTERPEAIDAGVAKLVGTTTQKILEITSELLDNSLEYERMQKITNPFGDGHASERILEGLKNAAKYA